ncbi:MAG: hypothetical protein GWO20_04270 [Candidatus Korarchaeota archaeon]|nr:hypothetical protein [Candidatus Korarchaeota archaeon]
MVGKNATIRGVIKQFEISPHDPVNVTIYYRLANETDGWIELATVETTRKGSYSYQWTVQDIGAYKVKASWLGDLPLMDGDESDEVSLEVVETAPFNVMDYLPHILGGIVVVIAVVVVLYFKKFR